MERKLSLDEIMFVNQYINYKMHMQTQKISVVSFWPKKNNMSKCHELGY